MKALFFVLLLTAGLLLSCSGEKTTEIKTAAKDTLSAEKTESLNPNGDSELAIMMREMVSNTQALHDSVEAGKSSGPYPEAFGKIFFMKKTDNTIDKDLFDGMATNYLNTLKFFYASPEKDRKKNFNAVVNSCISCHENFCHGPIKRIRKFLVKE